MTITLETPEERAKWWDVMRGLLVVGLNKPSWADGAIELYRGRLPGPPDPSSTVLARFEVVNRADPQPHHILRDMQGGAQPFDEDFDVNEWDVGTVVEVRRLPGGDAPPQDDDSDRYHSLADAVRAAMHDFEDEYSHGPLVAAWDGMGRTSRTMASQQIASRTMGHLDPDIRVRVEAAFEGGDAPQEPSSIDIEANLRGLLAYERGRVRELQDALEASRPPGDTGWGITYEGPTAGPTVQLADGSKVEARHGDTFTVQGRPPGGAEPGLREAMGRLRDRLGTHWSAMRISEVLAASEGAAPPSEPDDGFHLPTPEPAELDDLGRTIGEALKPQRDFSPGNPFAPIVAELGNGTPIEDLDIRTEPSGVPDAPGWWWRGDTPTEVYDTSDRSEGGALSFYCSQDGYLDVEGFTWGGKVERCTPDADAGLRKEMLALAEVCDEGVEAATGLIDAICSLHGGTTRTLDTVAADARKKVYKSIARQLRDALEVQS